MLPKIKDDKYKNYNWNVNVNPKAHTNKQNVGPSVGDRKVKSQFTDRTIVKEKLNNDSIQLNLNKKSGYYGMNINMPEDKNYSHLNMNYLNNSNNIHNLNNNSINNNLMNSKDITIIKNEDDSTDENFHELKMMMKNVFEI